jgi:hypothetical protein
LIEARNEAQVILEAVEKAHEHAAWQQLTFTEREQIDAAQRHLASVVDSTDRDVIRKGTETLDKATTRFAEIMMDSAVTSAIGGQTMNEAAASLQDSLGEAPNAPHPFAPADFK